MSAKVPNSRPEQALFVRLRETGRAPVAFTLDGVALEALEGDTVMTAVLTHRARLRQAEPSGAARAGFCMMGACQDCWMSTESGERFRACSSFIAPGMRLVSGKDAAP